MAKLQVLLDEKRAQDEAINQRPTTRAEDDAKRAAANASANAAAQAEKSYSLAKKTTETGTIVENRPITTEKGLIGHDVWYGPEEATGSVPGRLAVWGLGYASRPADGVVLIGRVYESTNGYELIKRIEVPGHGQVTVVDEKGGTVTLRGSDGAELLLDTKSLTLR